MSYKEMEVDYKKTETDSRIYQTWNSCWTGNNSVTHNFPNTINRRRLQMIGKLFLIQWMTENSRNEIDVLVTPSAQIFF